jgi:hypothetical protein
MGTETELAGRLRRPDVVRSRQPGERAAGDPVAIGPDRPAAAPPPGCPPASASPAGGAPKAADAPRQRASPRTRPGVVLQMQRAAGNRHTCRAIEQLRAAGPTTPSVHPAPANRAQMPSAGERSLRDGAPGAVPSPSTLAGPAASGAASPARTVVRRARPAAGPPIRRQAADLQAAHGGRPVIQRGFLSTLGDAAGAVSDVASGVVDTVSDAAGSAADAVSGLISSGLAKLRGAVDAIVGQLTRVWDTVKSGVASAVEGAIREASGFLGGIGSLFGDAGTALTGLDAGALGRAWAAITGVASTALAGVRGIVTRVTATVDQLWSGLRRLADGLIGGMRRQAEAFIDHLPGVAHGPARSLWSTIEGRLTGTWRKIESGWTTLRDAALKRVNQVVERVQGVVTSLKTSVVSTIIETFTRVQGFVAFVKQAIANPDHLIAPIVQEITRRLQALPERARGDAQARAQTQASASHGTGAAAAAPGTAPGVAAVQRSPAPSVQRDAAGAGQPRSTLGVSKVVSESWSFIGDKLAKLWGSLGATVYEMVLSLVWPPATWAGLKQDWHHMTGELSARASRFGGVRTDSWDGFWEDLRRWLSNLVDFPLIVWRAINAMLGRLSAYLGLAMILGGAVLGAIAAGTGGAVFGSVVPAAGTAAGGAAGIAAGAWAGAAAGYGAAETVGLVLLVSFAAGEELSIVKAIDDLLWVPQTAPEQEEDINQAADSVIALAAAMLLMGIAFIGVALAKRVWTLVKRVSGRLKPTPMEGDPATPNPGEPVPGTPERLVICRVCDIVPGVPKDIMEARAKLTPEARARLDKTAEPIFRPDPSKPTQTQFDSLRAFMAATEARGGGDLEAGLQELIARDAKAKQRRPPPRPDAKPPFGPKVAELPALRAEIEALISATDDFVRANPTKATMARANKGLRSVLDGPLTDMETGQVEASAHLVERLRGQAEGVFGELEAAKSAPPHTSFGEYVDGREIDQVRPDGTYYQVKREAPYPKSDSKYTDAETQLRNTLRSAVAYPVDGKPRPVVMEFQKGVTKEVADALRAIDVGGHRATIVGTELP